MNKKTLLSALALVASSFFAQGQAALTEQDVKKLLSHPQRPSADASRDEARRPEKIIPFIEVSKGDHILDLMAGGGWYTELFSMAVGEAGKVYLQNDEVIWRFAKDRAIARTENNRLANVTRIDEVAIESIDVPDNSVDVVFTALNYHDMFFVATKDKEGNEVKLRADVVDYKKAFAKVKSVMKDDAVLVIIDHFAPAGSGFEAPNSTHRIDPAIVKYQLDQAGFELVEEAFYLRNENDDLSLNVFSPNTRGKTDRFVYKFMKK